MSFRTTSSNKNIYLRNPLTSKLDIVLSCNLNNFLCFNLIVLDTYPYVKILSMSIINKENDHEVNMKSYVVIFALNKSLLRAKHIWLNTIKHSTKEYDHIYIELCLTINNVH